MMNRAFLSPSLLKAANEVLQWAEEFLTRENKDLHRPRGSQSICPFVSPSIKHDSCYMVMHPEINQDHCDEQVIEQVLLSYIPTFEESMSLDLKFKLTTTL